MLPRRIVQPLSLVLLLGVGILLGFKLREAAGPPDAPNEPELSWEGNLLKYEAVMEYLKAHYYEPVDATKLVEAAIVGALESLDPHTFYIPPAEMKQVNEDMEGSFEGIGIQFEIVDDTILVVTPISGGPSDRLGILAGDRIVEIEGSNVAGIGIKNEEVIKKLRGPKGSVVRVKMLRPGLSERLEFAIERDKIPLNSVDYSYMVNPTTGYIRVNRFSETTIQEFDEHLVRLNAKGMKNLILDLRNNPGGYLQMAKMMCDRLLEPGQMIVYTKGRTFGSSQEYKASNSINRVNPDGGIVVLINQGSASASEIVSGALQDHDRGLIVGQRSFGKGLVQQQYELDDGSAVRLVVSRYFTPSGRCIQKPFKKGNKLEYEDEKYERLESGELFDASKVKFPDSLKFKTAHGRTVYGGGAIMPDVFVPIDTMGRSAYLSKLIAKGIFSSFALRYQEQHPNLLTTYPKVDMFVSGFQVDNTLLNELTQFAKTRGVEPVAKEIENSRERLRENLKLALARRLFKDDGVFQYLNAIDPVFQKALSLMPQAIKLKQTGKF